MVAPLSKYWVSLSLTAYSRPSINMNLGSKFEIEKLSITVLVIETEMWIKMILNDC